MKINMFPLWKKWLADLGGSCPEVSEPPSQKRTGRRDPDTKPRQYELGEDYIIDSHGTVHRS